MFKTFYRLGFVPWDGHPLATSLQELVEGGDAAPDARLLLVEFITGGSYGVPGVDPDEVERRFAADWTLLSSGDEPAFDRNGKNPARHYLFARAS